MRVPICNVEGFGLRFGRNLERGQTEYSPVVSPAQIRVVSPRLSPGYSPVANREPARANSWTNPGAFPL